ncbi:uncharacterized protein AMSG_04510 [Thecamonas trahens ATCC 50062]|uniref:Cyclic nucleotide-binding domain-containing protein n=1 Tax=Thecamonas trahens ATCC 50062 TaxID=461836 RepID=A0A0L0D7U8_THETB|nr:hypothetical protein AMSG_04510 [Thecamonas trahens ATCC 50062]KNC48280.1 hypothetical protein AMSG_04510 [Thecamonas trahens ATCC 50062]|eukprot:XP_013758847.1 hypothetical protein AMSG_04510 [Thecamonas trahens ATCC 50062]
MAMSDDADDGEAHLPAPALQALEKTAVERSVDDIAAILAICESLPAVSKYPRHTRRELARRMVLVRYAAGEVVFYEGDEPDGYRIILAGSVYGMKQSADAAAAAAAAGVVALADGPVEGISIEPSAPSAADPPADKGGVPAPRLKRGRAMETFSQIIFTLRAGDGFGEGAMQKVSSWDDDSLPGTSGVEEHKRKFGVRGATIKCAEPTDILLVSLNDYVQILELAMQRDLEERVEFLSQRPLFYGWSSSRMNQLAKCMTIEKFLPNKPIILQGSEGKFLWMIRAGSVKIVRELKVGISRKTSEPVRKFLHIATLGVGEFFGELAIIHNAPHSASVLAASKCVVYKLPKPEFTKFIVDKALEIVQLTSANYPSDAELLAAYREQLTWERYKSRVVERVLSRKRTRRELQSYSNPTLRGFRSPPSLPSRGSPTRPPSQLHNATLR